MGNEKKVDFIVREGGTRTDQRGVSIALAKDHPLGEMRVGSIRFWDTEDGDRGWDPPRFNAFGYGLTRAQWIELRDAVDACFDEYGRRWPQ